MSSASVHCGGVIDVSRPWQFFWQDYQDRSYITALQHLARLRTAGKIRNLGLCNFDTKRTEEVCVELGRGYIVSNQVAVSVVKTRIVVLKTYLACFATVFNH